MKLRQRKINVGVTFTLDCVEMELMEVLSFETPLSLCDHLSVSGISLRGTLLDICMCTKRDRQTCSTQ